MNLTHLRYFSVVANQESITKASELLFVSQSAVSKTIKQLESELNVKLFDRVGRTIKLNRNGKLFYSYVNDSLNLLDRGISSVSGGIQTSEQQISILFEVASTLIPKIVNRIQQNLPNVRLNIAQHVQMDTDLQQYDFVVTTRKIPNYFTAQIIKEEVFVGWKSNYPNGTVKASTLTNTQFIGLGNHNQLRKTIDDYFHEQKLTINFKYETDDPATVRGLIDAGVGIGFIPAVTWKTAGKSLHLARLTPDIMSRTIYLCSSTHELNDIQREISNELIETFADAQKEQLTL
ncbi:Chromosome initiation inhibitor [Pediococcus damnosus]|uniref:Chromosome initiation inhibitor n=1 Tax=Pediococcus damnosus TaxID=51663 RepID=A0A0R2HDT8_9LACO|nr:LysR family transcriptional regulator [Pediococcus damnosus]AMV61468.1 Chromosome initiation inhibitor [Pediococcus damnosus]AMV62165.1 Chromosome initiation inhibitor [Pediococcus damnosus]AMV65830.1 Chromosome initiation inhibitor [Pediococcus damnosus]AMV67979.1 Chromosome initiation inhibitor [Pediococcus damnosus]AMV70169.1 Chromosome initiation inhibitor [Pediococcus damnosus]